VYAPWTGNWPALVTEITTALAVCFLSLWTLVPAPTAALLVLSVGTTEYCAWLVVSAAAIGGLALSQARRSRAARLAAGLALTACVLAARPLLQIPPTIRGFDAARSVRMPSRTCRPRLSAPCGLVLWASSSCSRVSRFNRSA
jgi:hypothetical protein